MSEEGDLFLEACGASGPLQLEWDDWESGEAVRRDFNSPSVLVGHNPDADLSLEHPRVGRRHAYLQMIEGRLYAIDLDSRDGLRWSGVPRRAGWIDRRRSMQLGPTTIRIIGGDRAESEDSVAGPGPLSRRFVARHPLPGVVLEIREADGPPKRWAMNRSLTLVGSSPDCKIQLLEPGTSRYACGLVRTPKGVWMVDLLSSRGVSVNGVVCRQAKLEDGDMLQVGGQALRLIYDGTATRPFHQALATPHTPAPIDFLARTDQSPTDATQDAWELVPEMILRQLQCRDGPAPEKLSTPFDHALLMLVRLLGDMQRDHVEVVREELEQIRQLGREMRSLRARSSEADPATTQLAETPPAIEQEVDFSRDRPAPQLVRAMAGERLAAWEKERQTRWRKVMGLLVKP
jgi:pSer/pThr/pTyr-binding forkhead associated (FHA) protein